MSHCKANIGRTKVLRQSPARSLEEPKATKVRASIIAALLVVECSCFLSAFWNNTQFAHRTLESCRLAKGSRYSQLDRHLLYNWKRASWVPYSKQTFKAGSCLLTNAMWGVVAICCLLQRSSAIEWVPYRFGGFGNLGFWYCSFVSLPSFCMVLCNPAFGMITSRLLSWTQILNFPRMDASY